MAAALEGLPGCLLRGGVASRCGISAQRIPVGRREEQRVLETDELVHRWRKKEKEQEQRRESTSQLLSANLNNCFTLRRVML